jgi:Iap family predicted aminopeptidase
MAVPAARIDHWLCGQNHNHLRITRIIRSVRLLKGDAEANAFRQHILGRASGPTSHVSAETRAYWAAA